MPRTEEQPGIVAEQVVEVRYTPSGSFLDVRGYVADYVRENSFFPHWKIDPNTVNFFDSQEGVKKEGAFVGYRSAGYLAYDPETRNYFVDRGGSFWKTLLKNQHYKIPPIERLGIRSKLFVPSLKSFEEINRDIFQALYTDKARELIGGIETDVQFIIELTEAGFDVRIAGGPIHKSEAQRHLSFKSPEFEKPGFFLDVDYYQTMQIKHEDVPRLLRSAVDLTWAKIERFAKAIGV